MADGIPKRRNLLPLVNKARGLALQDERGLELGKSSVLEVAGRVANQDFTLAVIGRRPGFAAPLRPLDTDCAKGG